MKLAIYEILEQASKIKPRHEKVKFLREHRSPTLDTIVVGAFYPDVKWSLPEQEPPYHPLDPVNAETFLYYEARRLYIFAEGGPMMPAHRRESLFIEFLESIHPQDAKVILAMINGKLPYRGMSVKLFNEAFPDLGLLETKDEKE